MDIFNQDGIPESYKTHLPDENVDPRQQAGEMMLKPFKTVSQDIKDSLARIYKVAAQPMQGEVVKPLPAESNPIEYYASLAARVVALPLVAMKEALDIGTSARKGAAGLRGGQAGEGDWTPEQYKTAAEATMTAGMAIGGGAPGGGKGPANMMKLPGLSKKVPVGQTFKSRVGPIKYDKAFIFEEGGPTWHQYTIQNAPHKGATFSAKSQKTADLDKGIQNIIDLAKKYGSYKDPPKPVNLQEKRLVKGLGEIQEMLKTGKVTPTKAPKKWLDDMRGIYDKGLTKAEKSGDLKEQLRMMKHIKSLDKFFTEY